MSLGQDHHPPLSLGTLPSRRLCIVGAGGHGRVVADTARSMEAWSDIRFFDDRWPSITKSGAWPVAGNFAALVGTWSPDEEVFVGVGDGQLRMSLLDTLVSQSRRPATIIHRSAVVSRDATIGAGSVVMPGAIVNIGAQIGRGVIINTGATVDHDCNIGDGVHIAPGAHLSGGVDVGRLSWIGVGSCVKQGIKIGAASFVGAGAAVVSDTQPATTVVGVPARPMKRT